jgi:hypothetical protein
MVMEAARDDSQSSVPVVFEDAKEQDMLTADSTAWHIHDRIQNSRNLPIQYQRGVRVISSGY